MINIALCDDEQIYLDKIKAIVVKHLSSENYKFKIDIFSSGKELLEVVKARKYDLVILDVNMDGLNGIEIARVIRCLYPNVSIAFVTAFLSYALDGYKVNAIRYILKDDIYINKTIIECINAVLEKMQKEKRVMEFDFYQGKIEVLLSQIVYIESNLHKIYFYLIDDGIKKYSMLEKLGAIENMISSKDFIRVHQSYLVNVHYIKKVKRYTLTLLDDTEINISKRYYKRVFEEYMRFRGDL